MVDAEGNSADWAMPGAPPAQGTPPARTPETPAPNLAPVAPASAPPAPATFTPGPPPPPLPASSLPAPSLPAPAAPTPAPQTGYAAPSSAPSPAHAAGAPVPGAPVQGLHTAPLTYRSWQPGILALRPLSFGDFLTVPFRAFKYSRATVVGGPTVMTLLSVAATLISGWLLFTDPLLGLSDFDPQFAGIEPLTVVALVIAVLSWFAADLLATAMVLIGISRAVLGEKVTFAAAWKQLLPRIPQLLLLYVLTGVVFLVAGLLSSLLMIGGIISDAPGATSFGVFLMFGLLFPFGLVISVYLPAARGALVMERVNVVAAARRSIAIMKGRFWWTVLILMVCVVAVGVVSNIVQTAGQFLGLFGILLMPDNEWAFAISFGIGYGKALVLSNIITYAFLGSVYALLYVDGRMRREGFDVELARAAEARHQPAQVVVG